MKTIYMSYDVAKNSSATERLAMHREYDKVTADDFKKVLVFEKFTKPVNKVTSLERSSCQV